MAQYNTASPKVNAYLATTDALTNERDQLSRARYNNQSILLQQATQNQHAYEYEQERKLAEQKRLREEQENRLMASAYKSLRPLDALGQGEDSSSQLAMQATKIGESLMAVNPKRGMEFLDKAEQYKATAQNFKLNTVKFREAQAQASYNIYAGVTDETSWEAAKPELAKVGLVPPKELTQWSPRTQEYVDNQKIFSKSYQAAQRLENDGIRTDVASEKEARIAEKEKQEAADKARKEALKQNNMHSKQSSAKDLEVMMVDLEGTSENFANLDDDLKMSATTRFDRIRKDFLAKGLSPTEADTRARIELDKQLAGGTLAPQTVSTPTGSSIDDRLKKYIK
jgi:hypothetical protein